LSIADILRTRRRGSDIRTFVAKNVRFFEDYDVYARPGGGGVEAVGTFCGQWVRSIFCDFVRTSLYGRPLIKRYELRVADKPWLLPRTFSEIRGILPQQKPRRTFNVIKSWVFINISVAFTLTRISECFYKAFRMYTE